MCPCSASRHQLPANLTLRPFVSGVPNNVVRCLSWSQQTLADQAGVGMMTVHQFERDGSHPGPSTQDVVRRAFEAEGVQFIDENGVVRAYGYVRRPPRNLKKSSA
jgi:hypothetical protein